MEVQQLKRVFKHKKKNLADVDPTLSPDEVMNIYSHTYPELVNAKVEGPKIEKNQAIFTFSSSLGTKG